MRVVVTMDVDPEQMRDRYPLMVERAGGVREAARSYALGAVQASNAVRNASIRSVSLTK
ncbi:hypothetical protein NPS70_16265 [Streptomyces sp. C10-9-1]|uniref:hypothetical protein n=1 Tax=Streptomyces sp. C10-9-1 TaxID=1859285 RepID=UPI0021110D9C|nr:hypothetical protein [Streptomyces sp. C10-9-1]MCQ6554740.1 hypothetical protein [Streptomyces sp. C10-9-1]